MEASSSPRRGPAAPKSTSNGRRRYNPKAGLGILSAITAPASMRVRIVEQARFIARAILEATPGLCCRGYNCSVSRSSSWRPLTAGELLLPCSLCHRWISGGPICMYKGEMGFYEAGCRYDYVTDQELKMRRSTEAVVENMPRSRRATPPRGDDLIYK